MATLKLERACCRGVRYQNSARRFDEPVPLIEKCLDRRILQNRQARIIEFGAGCLRNCLFLQQNGFESITALEIPDTVERFQPEVRRFIRRGGRVLTAIPRRGQFDFVIMTFVLETICPVERRRALLLEGLRLLKPGGRLLLCVRGPKDIKAANLIACRYERSGFATTQRTFIRRYTVSEIVRLLGSHGMQHISHLNTVEEPRIIEIIAQKT